MASRRAAPGSDSLELLLDTICNVFGGIILMAILVVLQTQTSAGRIPEPKPADVERALEAQRLRFEYSRLEVRAAALKDHRQEIERTFHATTSPSGQRLSNTVEEFRKAVEEAGRRVTVTEAETATARKDQTEAADLLQTADRLLKGKQAEVDQLEADLQQSSQTLPKQVRLPHRRGRAPGTARYYVVKGAMAYELHAVGFNWLGGVQRMGQCFITPVRVGVAAKVTPIDGTGYPVTDRAVPQGFVTSLRPYPHGLHYVVFFVYDDSQSYTAFQVVKDAVVNLRYAYMVQAVIVEDGAFTVTPVSGHETE